MVRLPGCVLPTQLLSPPVPPGVKIVVDCGWPQARIAHCLWRGGGECGVGAPAPPHTQTLGLTGPFSLCCPPPSALRPGCPHYLDEAAGAVLHGAGAPGHAAAAGSRSLGMAQHAGPNVPRHALERGGDGQRLALLRQLWRARRNGGHAWRASAQRRQPRKLWRRCQPLSSAACSHAGSEISALGGLAHHCARAAASARLAGHRCHVPAHATVAERSRVTGVPAGGHGSSLAQRQLSGAPPTRGGCASLTRRRRSPSRLEGRAVATGKKLKGLRRG